MVIKNEIKRLYDVNFMIFGVKNALKDGIFEHKNEVISHLEKASSEILEALKLLKK